MRLRKDRGYIQRAGGAVCCRLTEQRAPDSPGGRAASARRTSSSSSPQPQPHPAAAAAAAAVGSSSTLTAAGDDTPSVGRSPNHAAAAAGAPAASAAAVVPTVVSQRFSAVHGADAQPQRAGSYHGEFHRTTRNRFADSPLRAISVDAAGRVRVRTARPRCRLLSLLVIGSYRTKC